MTSECILSEIVFYPVKSLKGIHLKTANIDLFGIQNDRRLMLIDDENRFVTQRKYPQLALLHLSVDSSEDGTLKSFIISSDSLGAHTVLISDFFSIISTFVNVQVWGDSVKSRVISNSFTEQVSNWLGISVRLAYMPDECFRQVDRQYFSRDQRVSFADAFPLLLTSEFSLADLNGRLIKPVPMTNFRPNLVVSGNLLPYEEDNWTKITIGAVAFKIVKPCSRCVMTTVDQFGKKSEDTEPLMTLSKYRKNEFGVCFGQNLVQLNAGKIRLGDVVKVE